MRERESGMSERGVGERQKRSKGWENGQREPPAWEEDAKRPGPNFSTITGGGQAVIEFLLATTSQFAIKPSPSASYSRCLDARFDSSFKRRDSLVRPTGDSFDDETSQWGPRTIPRRRF